MGYANQIALKLPDQLLVRYYRAAEIDSITKVQKRRGTLTVTLVVDQTPRVDQWKDLGGGLGFVPEKK